VAFELIGPSSSWPQKRRRNRPNCKRRKAFRRLLRVNAETYTRDRTGWLGREDSNLRMAESKSDKFANVINMHSEKIAKFDPLSTNRLAPDSECASMTSA
jgi:hypothetical protein